MLLVSLGTFVVVALLAWSFIRTGKSSAEVPARAASLYSTMPPAQPRYPRKPAVAPTPLTALPRLEEEEDIDVTVVTASPHSQPAPVLDAGEPGGTTSSTGRKEQRPSKVAVIYEEEAAEEEVTLPVARILVSACGQSDRGNVRQRNEDALLVFPERSLFAVADGMGGHAGGEVASAIAVDTLWSAFERNTFEGKTDCDANVPRRGRELACAVQMANQAIFEHAKSDPELKDMGTTLVVARFSPNKQRVYVGHVGDSRCYRLRGGHLRQLTTDHTMRELGYKGAGANALFQAVGVKPTIMIDLIIDKPRADDVYLLCSDGLPKMVEHDEIRNVLSFQPDVEATVRALIDIANARGGKDNVTALLVKVLERAPSMGR